MGLHLGGVGTLHVGLGTAVDSPLKHLLNASHQEDIRVGARYGEHSLWGHVRTDLNETHSDTNVAQAFCVCLSLSSKHRDNDSVLVWNE